MWEGMQCDGTGIRVRLINETGLVMIGGSDLNQSNGNSNSEQ